MGGRSTRCVALVVAPGLTQMTGFLLLFPGLIGPSSAVELDLQYLLSVLSGRLNTVWSSFPTPVTVEDTGEEDMI